MYNKDINILVAKELQRLATECESQKRYAQVDKIDQTSRLLSTIEDAPNMNSTLKSLFTMIGKIDKYYAAQILTLNNKVKELAQAQGIQMPEDSLNSLQGEESYNKNINVAPGSTVSVNADDASSAEINL